MKSIFFSALLALSTAAAQNTGTAVPALPVPTAPTVTETASTLPATRALILNAPVGAGVELKIVTTNRTALTDLQVTALPGSDLSAEELQDLRGVMLSEMGDGMNEETTVEGKVFYRVAERGADGSVTLLTTMLQNRPGLPTNTLKMTQILLRDGSVGALKLRSDNRLLDATFAGLTPQKLEQLVWQYGFNVATLYGQPLVVGQARMQKSTTDPSELLAGIFGAVAQEKDMQDMFGNMQSTPLDITITTTYDGPGPTGLLTFSQRNAHTPWQVKTGGVGDMPALDMDVLETQEGAMRTFTGDGLPGPSSQTMHMVMRMTVVIEDMQVEMTLNVDQSVLTTR